MFRCVRGHGGRQAWLTTVSPAHLTPFPYRPMHVRPVWCWLACVRSVYGHVVSAAVVLMVSGRVSRLLVGWLGVGSLALQQALAQSDLLRACVLLVAVLVGASCVGLARYVFTVRRLPTVGEKSNDKWFDHCKNLFQIWCPFPCPALAALHAQPIIWYFAVLSPRPSSFACAIHMYTALSVARPRRSPLVRPCAPHGSPSVQFRLGSAVVVLVSACLPCAISCRVLQVMWLACLCPSAELSG